MTDAVIAKTAGDGVDPRKPPLPEEGAQHVYELDGTELVLLTKPNNRGTYYASTRLIGAVGGTGGGGSSDLTVSSNNGATTVGPKEGDDVLQLVQDIVFGGFLIYREDGEGHIANVEAITGYVLGLNTQDRPSDPTANVVISSGNAGGGSSGDIILRTGTATDGRGRISLDGGYVELPGLAAVLLNEAPNDSTTVAALFGNDDAANQSLAIIPKGNGALSLAVPTGDSTGGNLRGTYAVDLQIFEPGKASATMVASGYHAYAEGVRNTASGPFSHAEGYGNTAQGSTSHAEGDNTIAQGAVAHSEGLNTSAAGNFSHAEGYGTTSQGDDSHSEGYGTLAGGTASHAEGNATQATNSNAHAEGSGTTAGGDSSHAEGHASVANGQFAHAEGDTASAGGYATHAEGGHTSADGDYSQATGLYAWTRGVLGFQAYATGIFNTIGDMQLGRLVLRALTGDDTPTVLTSDGGPAATTTNQVTLLANTSISFRGRVVARKSDGTSSTWEFVGGAKRGANVGSSAMIAAVTPSVIAQDAGASSWALDVFADTDNGAINVIALGAAATDIHWVCRMETEEVTF